MRFFAYIRCTCPENMRFSIALLLLNCWLLQPLRSQNTIGLPEILNYSKLSYRAGTQNWDICQDKSGLLYFANNEGLLSFDGTYWKNHPLPNKTIVRSIAIGTDGRLYVGAQDEIGYFSPSPTGILTYHSVKDMIPPQHRSFTDVWDIVCFEGKVFFRSNDRIFMLADNHITVYPSNTWLFLGVGPQGPIAQDVIKGVMLFRQGSWQSLIPRENMPPGFLITAVVALHPDTLLLTTLKHGIFRMSHGKLEKMQTPALSQIADYHIYGATLIDKNSIALATTTRGCVIIDPQGQTIQQFSRQEGLQNNNVLAIYADRHKNLWLGLDNGIDFIAYNSAIKNIFPDKSNESAGYSAMIHQAHLYLATTNGLYSVPLEERQDLSFVKGNFQQVTNGRGQAWNLSTVNGQLLMGHHEGAYVINGDQAKPLDNSGGFWTFQPLNSVSPSDLMVAGTYQGIRFFTYKNGKFVHDGAQATFESSRFVAVDHQDVWVSHPYKGVYRVKYNDGKPTVQSYAEKFRHGLSSNGNYIFRIRNRIVVTTENGIYEYDAATDSFLPSAYFRQIFGDLIIRYLREDMQGNVWFVYDKSLGVADFSGAKPRIIYIPELNRKLVSGFEQVYPVDEHNIFVGAEKGYFHINYAKYKQHHPVLQVHLREVKALGKTDTLLFGGYFRDVSQDQTQQQTPSINYNSNSLHFTFSAPLYEQQTNIEYSYYLKGYDKKWSEWSEKTEKEYAYLPPGTYNFQLRARNNLGNESVVYSYCFYVLPPWYRSWWAYTLYGCLVLMGAYLVYRWQKRKFQRQRTQYETEQKRLRYLHELEVAQYEEEQKRQQYLHQLELEKNEKEIIRLKNEKLEAEIAFQNKEMASTTMHLVKKGELLTKMKDELQKVTRSTDDEKSLDVFRRMIKTLGNEDKMDKDWEHFTIHFDKVHNDFFIALKAKHPNLTANELKLCAYLRMNLSTKEIAQLMNISGRGVEISRYRLRKKLQIPTETNLFTYFLDFHSNTKDSPVAPAPDSRV